MMGASELFDLHKAAETLATWADMQPLKTVYVYGSRVRGDAKSDSDLDVAYDFLSGADITHEAMEEWARQHGTDFAALKEALGVGLQFLDYNDKAMLQRIRLAAKTPVLKVRKVVCVILPPKASVVVTSGTR
jgi:predicted nucleotidyltransferase